jgi:hypothetical protein
MLEYGTVTRILRIAEKVVEQTIQYRNTETERIPPRFPQAPFPCQQAAMTTIRMPGRSHTWSTA